MQPVWWTPKMPASPPPEYAGLVEWRGVSVPENEIPDLEDGVKRIGKLSHDVKHLASMQAPREAVFFWVHRDDERLFDLVKDSIGARWWRDVPEDDKCRYPRRFREAHPEGGAEDDSMSDASSCTSD